MSKFERNFILGWGGNDNNFLLYHHYIWFITIILMSQSQKHHFLPVFYLKGFANENEQFKIFNVKTKRFKQKGNFFLLLLIFTFLRIILLRQISI